MGAILRSFILLAVAVGLGIAVLWGASRMGKISPAPVESPARDGRLRTTPAPGGSATGDSLVAPAAVPVVSGGIATSPFVGIAERLLPAIVSIDSERTFRHGDLGPQGPQRERLRRLFPDLEDEEVELPSSGSGFFIDQQGRIVTNYHVVRDAQRVTVMRAGGTRQEARVVGVDPASDVAVLEVAALEPTPFVPVGDAAQLRIGEWVAAIGNPFGNLQGTVTVGVVSAMGRDELSIAGGTPVYQDFIQTDASINFGNSGGPLVNTRGEAVGINTAFNAPGHGIGFAISMTMARGIIQELIERGRVSRGYLGITLQPLDPDLAEGWELGARKGVVVSDVLPGTPAQQAGLRPGDVIVGIAGEPVEAMRPFQRKVGEIPAGTDVELRILRGGRDLSLHVRLGERPSPQLERPGPHPDLSTPHPDPSTPSPDPSP